MEQGNEIARIRQQIDLELESAQRGLHSFASTARHDFINARMQHNGERILQLIEEGKHEEAQALMNAVSWEKEGQTKDDETAQSGITKDNQKTKRREEEKQGIKRG